MLKKFVATSSAHMVEAWFDRNSRNWIIQVLDAEGFELDSNIVGNKSSAKYSLDAFLKQYSLEPKVNAQRIKEYRKKNGF